MLRPQGSRPGLAGRGNTVEELDDAGLERVLGADDDQAVVCDQLLEDLRAMAQVVRRDADVRAHGLLHQGLGVVPQIRGEQRLDRRAHPVDDRAQVARLVLTRLLELLERREDGAALRVAEHDDQPRAEPRGGELDAADLRRRDDVAGDADHEQVAEALVEDDLGGHPRVGAAEDDGERLLACDQRVASLRAREPLAAPDAGCEAAVALLVNVPALLLLR